ncbi:hypothetical protein T06_16842 [Trichinella sp. T6]|nr:hypothetical protein T06_16842 [Trichinella sp. T6]
MNYFPTSNRTIMKISSRLKEQEDYVVSIKLKFFAKIDITALLKKIHKNNFVKGEKNRQNAETCDRDSMQNNI